MAFRDCCGERMNRIEIAIILSLIILPVLVSTRCGGNGPQKPVISKEQQQRIDAQLAQIRANQAAALAASQETSRREQECKSQAWGYLIALQTGDWLAAAGFWRPDLKSKKLFAVHSYQEIVSGPYWPAKHKGNIITRIYHQFEIESSTQGGFPIRKRWNIVMEPESKNFADRDCAIVDLVEAE